MRTLRGNRRRLAGITMVAGAIVLGVGGPAVAEGQFESLMKDWRDGNRSRTWTDLNKDNTNARATFYTTCTREFRATIRRERKWGPDTNMGSEWIDCRSYKDAVEVGDVAAGNYHFDVTGLGAVCISGKCTPKVTSVPKVVVYW
jgi:hypothetical protein